MKVFCAPKHKPIKGSALSHLDFTEVGSALALMHSAHVTTKALAVFKLLLANVTNVPFDSVANDFALGYSSWWSMGKLSFFPWCLFLLIDLSN